MKGFSRAEFKCMMILICGNGYRSRTDNRKFDSAAGDGGISLEDLFSNSIGYLLQKNISKEI
jgi:hypothetical protein